MTAHKPFIIGIGGAHSSVGKTTLAVAIISYLMKHRSHPLGMSPRIGAVKYTKEGLYACIIDDENIINEGDKDTARLSSAGAEKVLWIRSPREGLEEPLSIAMSRFAGLDCIVIEGNSAIEFAKPDIVIFISGEPGADTKPSAETIKSRADIIIAPETASTINGSVTGGSAALVTLNKYPYIFADRDIQGIIKLMENIAIEKEIALRLKERSVEGRISCTLARKIAEELDVPYGKVGSTANQLKIKIKSCELGCF